MSSPTYLNAPATDDFLGGANPSETSPNFPQNNRKSLQQPKWKMRYRLWNSSRFDDPKWQPVRPMRHCWGTIQGGLRPLMLAVYAIPRSVVAGSIRVLVGCAHQSWYQMRGCHVVRVTSTADPSLDRQVFPMRRCSLCGGSGFAGRVHLVVALRC